MCTPRPASAFKIGGQRGDERFALAGLHFGDFAFVQHDAADQLHVEMAHRDRAPSCFAHQGEGRNQCRLERVGKTLLEVGFDRIGITQTFFHFES